MCLRQVRASQRIIRNTIRHRQTELPTTQRLSSTSFTIYSVCVWDIVSRLYSSPTAPTFISPPAPFLSLITSPLRFRLQPWISSNAWLSSVGLFFPLFFKKKSVFLLRSDWCWRERDKVRETERESWLWVVFDKTLNVISGIMSMALMWSWNKLHRGLLVI